MLVASCHGATSPRADTEAGDLVIRNVSIISGPAFAPVAGQEIVVREGRIVAIRRQTGAAYADARVIDGAGGFVLPGFIDMHAHILIPRCEHSAGVTERFDIPTSERMLGVLLQSGVTTLRSPANPTESGLALRDRANAGEVDAPFIRAAAELINDLGERAHAFALSTN